MSGKLLWPKPKIPKNKETVFDRLMPILFIITVGFISLNMPLSLDDIIQGSDTTGKLFRVQEL